MPKQNNKLEGVLYIGGGIFRLADTSTDWYYWYTQEFELPELKQACLVFLMAPSILFLFIGLAGGLRHCCCGRY